MSQINKNHEQLAKLLKSHQNKIYAYIVSIVHNLSDADDLFQETVMILCRKFETFEQGSNFGAWSLTIAKNVVLNFRQKKRNAHVLINNSVFELVSQQSAIEIKTVEKRQQALTSCLKKLTPDDIHLLKLRFDTGEKIKSIAENMDKPVKSLYKKFSQLHESLRECINRTIADWEKA